MVDIQIGKINRVNEDQQSVDIKSTVDGSIFTNVPLGNSINIQVFPRLGAPVLFCRDVGNSTTRIIKIWDVDVKKQRPLLANEVQIQAGGSALRGGGFIYFDAYGNVSISSGLLQNFIEIDNENGIIKLESSELQIKAANNTEVNVDADGKLEIVKKDATGLNELSKITMHVDGEIEIDSMTKTMSVKGNIINVESDNINLGGSTGIRKLIDERIVSIYNGHFHPSGAGPTGPPVVKIGTTELNPLQINVATQKVKGK